MEAESVFGFHLHNQLFKEGIINERDVIIADERRLETFKESLEERQKELHAKQYKDRKAILDEAQELLLREFRSTEQNDKLLELLNKLGLELDEHGLVTLDTHSQRKRPEKKYLGMEEPCFSLQERRLIEEEENLRVQRQNLRKMKIWLRKIGGAQVQVRKPTFYGPGTNWKHLGKEYRMRTRDRMNQMEIGRRQKINSLCADRDKEWKRILYGHKTAALPSTDPKFETIPREPSTEQPVSSAEKMSSADTTETDGGVSIGKSGKSSSGQLHQSKSLIQQYKTDRKSIHEYHVPLSMRLRSSDLENPTVQKRLRILDRWIEEKTGDAGTRQAGKASASTSTTRKERKSLSYSEGHAVRPRAKSQSQLGGVRLKQIPGEDPPVSEVARTVSTQKTPGVVRSVPLKVLDGDGKDVKTLVERKEPLKKESSTQKPPGVVRSVPLQVLKRDGKDGKTLQAGTTEDKAGQDEKIATKVSDSLIDSKDQRDITELQPIKSDKDTLKYDGKSERTENQDHAMNLLGDNLPMNADDILNSESEKEDEMEVKGVDAFDNAISSPEQSESKVPETVHTDDNKFSPTNLSAIEASTDDIKAEESISQRDYERASERNENTELQVTKHHSEDDNLEDKDSGSKRKSPGLDDKSVDDDEKKAVSDEENVLFSNDEKGTGKEGYVVSGENLLSKSETRENCETEGEMPALLKQSEEPTKEDKTFDSKELQTPSKDESNSEDEKTSLEQLYEEINALAAEFYRQKESSSENGLKDHESNSSELPPTLSDISEESVTSKILQCSSEPVKDVEDVEASHSNTEQVGSSEYFDKTDSKKDKNTMATPKSMRCNIRQSSGSVQSAENAVRSSEHVEPIGVAYETVYAKPPKEIKKTVTGIRLKGKAPIDSKSTSDSDLFPKHRDQRDSKEIRDQLADGVSSKPTFTQMTESTKESNSDSQSFRDTDPLLESKSVRSFRRSRSLSASRKSITDFQGMRKSKTFSDMAFDKLTKSRKTKPKKSKYEKLDDYADDDDEN